ncbi:MAG: SMC family ATPase [Christensenella sp.]
MMPELLTFEAFGPYVKKQTVDFTKLMKAGLFLIHGETGAGKTTVLDAMTYAMFGESSGGERGEISAMRSAFAADEQDTVVEFTLSANGKRYRFTRGVRIRTKRNGEKEPQMTQNVFFMNAEGVFEPCFENPGIKNVRAKAEEILGLTYEQFRQVVLLPQGKFEKLLVADSAEKEKILVTLFKAERWQEITDWLCEQALILKRDKNADEQSIQMTLAQYNCEKCSELAELYTQKKSEAAEQEKQCALIAEQVIAAQEVLQNAQTVEQLFAEYEQAEKKQEETEQRKAEIDMLKKRCARAGDAAGLLPERRSIVALQQQWQEHEKKARESKQDVHEAEKKIEEHIKELQGIAKFIAREKQLCKEETEKLRESKEAADKVYRRLFADYMSDAAYALSTELEDGKACPVCGSTEHPSPAPRSDTKSTMQAVENAEQHSKMLQTQISEAEQRLYMLEREKEQCADGLKSIGASTAFDEAQCVDKKHMKRSLEDAQRLILQIKTAKASLELYERLFEQAQSVFEQAVKDFRAKCAEKGFDTDEELRQAAMNEQEIEAARGKIQDYFVQKEVAEVTVKSLGEKLRGIKRADISSLEDELDVKAKASKHENDALAENKALLAIMKTATELTRKRETELQKKTEEYVELDTFSKLLRGSNGVSLQRYVLGIMFAAITQEANRFLKKVHDGRYELYRTTEGVGGARRVGLDLEVFDACSGERRSVNSLSGGEKFFVALALSLGLSAVVQVQSGGIHIDAMFIDEGFGSLDSKTIEDVMDILMSACGASKLIGIISHVQALKENIEATIEVKKERTGSNLIINV